MVDEAAAQALIRKLCPLYAQIDLSVESVRDGIYRCRVPLNEMNGNHLKTVHAAIQWTAAEVLGGLVAIRIVGAERLTAMHVAVQSVSINFKRPARSAIIAEAIFDEKEAIRIRHRIDGGKETTFRLSAVVRSENGETVAVTEAFYVLRSPRRAKPKPRLIHEDA